MPTLTEIANKYTCDKGTEHYEKHGYTEEYQKIIPSSGEVNLLEIGVWHGDSLKMWREYNPEMKIDAIDINMDVYNYIKDSDKIKIHIGDQTDYNFLTSVVSDKTYDFIIDDGSHKSQDIIMSFKFLYDYLKPGGYYFIEDLHASHAVIHLTILNIMNYLNSKGNTSTQLYCDNKLLVIQK
jgi:cephalosporin hydroxylase